MKEAHKGAFFTLRALHELRTGENVRTKRELLALLALLDGDEREILTYGLSPAEGPLENVFARLLRWSAAAMDQAGRVKSANIT